MIRAGHRKFFVIFFDFYTKWMLRRHFQRIIIYTSPDETDKPVMMIGNHFSWWDGFIANYINLELFRRKIHIMMLEEQLRGRMFLNKAGAFSIRKKSRSAIESLDYTVGLLENRDHLVVLYPQGEFQSVYSSRIRFQPGIMRVLKGLRKPVQMVFYAALTDYFSSSRPHLSIYLETVDPDDLQDIKALENAYNDFYNACKEKQMKE